MIIPLMICFLAKYPAPMITAESLTHISPFAKATPKFLKYLPIALKNPDIFFMKKLLSDKMPHMPRMTYGASLNYLYFYFVYTIYFSPIGEVSVITPVIQVPQFLLQHCREVSEDLFRPDCPEKGLNQVSQLVSNSCRLHAVVLRMLPELQELI